MGTAFPIMHNSLDGLFGCIREERGTIFEGLKDIQTREAAGGSFISVMMEMKNEKMPALSENLFLSNLTLSTEDRGTCQDLLMAFESSSKKEAGKPEKYNASLSGNITPVDLFSKLEEDYQVLEKDYRWPSKTMGKAPMILEDKALEKDLLVKAESVLQKATEIIVNKNAVYPGEKVLPDEAVVLNEHSNNSKSEYLIDKTVRDEKSNWEAKNLLLKSGLESDEHFEKVIGNEKGSLEVKNYLFKTGLESDERFNNAIRDEKGNLDKKNVLFKSGLNAQKAEEMLKHIKMGLKAEEALPRLEFDLQNVKLINQKTDFFVMNLLSNEAFKIDAGAVTIKPDNKENGSLFSNSQSSYRSIDAVLSVNETETAQKTFQSEVLAQIVEKAVLNLKSNHPEIKIHLKPEFLGQLKMRISTEDHQVIIRILTESPMIKEVIENNVDHLKSALQKQGLEIDKFDVWVAHDSDQKGNGYEKPSFLNMEGETNEEEVGTALFEEGEETNNITEESTGINLIDFFA